jgi:integrase
MKKEKTVRSGELALSEDEVDQVLSATDRMRDYHVIKLTVLTGMRRGDIVRVKWENLDSARNRLEYKEKKKGDGYHQAWLPDSYISELNRFQGHDDTNNIWLFDGRNDKKYGQGHISSRTAYNIFERACNAAGIEPRRFHALRSTCIKLCKKKGWSMEATARHVNDSIETIKHHYLTPSREEMRRTAQENPLL